MLVRPAATLPRIAPGGSSAVPPVPDLLFVYGTLRPALAVGRPRQLVGDLELVATATVAGVLHDLGHYPGLVAGRGVVRGDLVRLDDDARLVALDAYEGCGPDQPLFRREITKARLPGGEEVSAWVYVYARPVGSAPAVRDGDYAAHRGRPLA